MYTKFLSPYRHHSARNPRAAETYSGILYRRPASTSNCVTFTSTAAMSLLMAHQYVTSLFLCLCRLVNLENGPQFAYKLPDDVHVVFCRISTTGKAKCYGINQGRNRKFIWACFSHVTSAPFFPFLSPLYPPLREVALSNPVKRFGECS